jgi:glyoxylase-like metal-dependent hydrolase (beta-lactamase superfamily II)
MKIIPLSEGSFTVDQSKKFVPFQPGTDDLQQRTKGSLLVEIQPFAVTTSRDILLLDTGLGFADDDNELQIHKNLALHNISASDVTRVLLSHLHKDHSGGICRPGNKLLSFENATYYINRNEWDFAFEKTSRSYITDDFLALKGNKQLQFTESNGAIENYIKYEMTGAHSPFHQVFLIEEDGQKIFFGGDVAPQLHQMKNRFKAKYDYDGKKAMELRQHWWKVGEEEKWAFLFYHDIKCPVYKFG